MVLGQLIKASRLYADVLLERKNQPIGGLSQMNSESSSTHSISMAEPSSLTFEHMYFSSKIFISILCCIPISKDTLYK